MKGSTTRGSPCLGSVIPSRERMLVWWKPFIMMPSLRNRSTSPTSVIPVHTHSTWHINTHTHTLEIVCSHKTSHTNTHCTYCVHPTHSISAPRQQQQIEQTVDKTGLDWAQVSVVIVLKTRHQIGKVHILFSDLTAQ